MSEPCNDISTVTIKMSLGPKSGVTVTARASDWPLAIVGVKIVTDKSLQHEVVAFTAVASTWSKLLTMPIAEVAQ